MLAYQYLQPKVKYSSLYIISIIIMEYYIQLLYTPNINYYIMIHLFHTIACYNCGYVLILKSSCVVSRCITNTSYLIIALTTIAVSLVIVGKNKCGFVTSYVTKTYCISIQNTRKTFTK